MKIKRRTEIVTEIQRRVSFVVRQPVRFFCVACGAPAEMFSINEAAKKAETGWREIVYSIENGGLHSAETEKGEIYVCAESLFRSKINKQIGEK